MYRSLSRNRGYLGRIARSLSNIEPGEGKTAPRHDSRHESAARENMLSLLRNAICPPDMRTGEGQVTHLDEVSSTILRPIGRQNKQAFVAFGMYGLV